MKVEALCTMYGGGEVYEPGSILDLPDEDAESLIRRGSAKRAHAGEPATGVQPSEAKKSGPKPKRKSAKAKADDADAGESDTDLDDKIMAVLIELSEDGKPSASAVSEALGQKVSEADVDRIWEGLQA